MKAKEKNLIRERSYFSYLLTAISSAFKWRVPESVEEKFLEDYLHITGMFGAQKQPDGTYYIVECPSRTGQLDQYGDGMTIEGVTRGNGYDIQGTIGKDVAICYNNRDRIPDLDLIRYADAFTQVDKAIMANVRWTILAPVLCTSDDRVTKKLNELIDDMLEGKLKCITSEDVLAALNGNGTRGEGVYSVDITHPERIRNVQYQSELYDVLMRRFFNKYGLNIQNTSKHAQATSDEVHGLDAVAWVLILDMLKERKKFCEEANRLWGDDWGVELSEVWTAEYERFKQRETEQAEKPEAEKEGADNGESVGASGDSSADG